MQIEAELLKVEKFRGYFFTDLFIEVKGIPARNDILCHMEIFYTKKGEGGKQHKLHYAIGHLHPRISIYDKFYTMVIKEGNFIYGFGQCEAMEGYLEAPPIIFEAPPEGSESIIYEIGIYEMIDEDMIYDLPLTKRLRHDLS